MHDQPHQNMRMQRTTSLYLNLTTKSEHGPKNARSYAGSGNAIRAPIPGLPLLRGSRATSMTDALRSNAQHMYKNNLITSSKHTV